MFLLKLLILIDPLIARITLECEIIFLSKPSFLLLEA